MGRRRNDDKIQVVNIRMVREPSLYSEDWITCPEDAAGYSVSEVKDCWISFVQKE